MIEPFLAIARQSLQAAGWSGQTMALLVAGPYQRLFGLDDRQVLGQWRVSTGRAGFGCREGSGCTPVGLHRIAARLGDQAAPGSVFKGRQPTGEILLEGYGPGTDLVTTRILWLAGLEPGINQGDGLDSYQRYIYIHGTPQRQLLGQPHSAGCVRMAPEDIVQLYEQVQEGTLVLIWDTLPP